MCSLKSGAVKSYLVGRKFGCLTVTGKGPGIINYKGDRVASWECVCTCGMKKNLTERYLTNTTPKKCEHVNND